jgi:hypothetical protein
MAARFLANDQALNSCQWTVVGGQQDQRPKAKDQNDFQ